MLGDEGEVLAGQLVLERLGRGGHHHRALGQQRGHQVGEALARAGAGLHHQVPAVLDGGGDGDGHRALTGPGLAAAGQLRHDTLERRRRRHAPARLPLPPRRRYRSAAPVTGARRMRQADVSPASSRPCAAAMEPGRAPAGSNFAQVSTTDGLDLDRIPVHVGCVMDGNGRWAQQRGLKRTDGHAAGEEALFDAVEGALELGIRWLTVYAFSTENWRRPVDEVRYLMRLQRVDPDPPARRAERARACASGSSAGATGGCPRRLLKRQDESIELTRATAASRSPSRSTTAAGPRSSMP